MLGDDIAAALPGLRAQAESMMRDSCVITGPAGAPVWDEAAGTYTTGEPVVVYTGPCRVRQASAAPQTTDAGETGWAVDAFVLLLPVSTSTAVGDGHTVAFTAASDPALLAVTAQVQGGHAQTFTTARRLLCKVVTRDAGV